MEALNPTAEALDQMKKGGDVEKAKVYALLALAEAVDNLASEVMTLGTEGHPINTWEQNQ